jgi:hypothetical protein
MKNEEKLFKSKIVLALANMPSMHFCSTHDERLGR